MGSQLYSVLSISALFLQVLLVSQVLQGHLVLQVLLALKVNMDRENLADCLGALWGGNEHSSLPVSLILHFINQKYKLAVLILAKIYFGRYI